MKFISFRRYYLDKYLTGTSFHGRVLDIGGKKDKKRGHFRPPMEKVESWEYLNIDASTNPEYICSVENIPVNNDYFNMIVLTEVLEHLENPEAALKECFRVLQDNGTLIATMPFLYPLHADPFDFQRWLPAKINKEFRDAGFRIHKLTPMGGIIAVLFDILNVYANSKRVNFLFRFIRKLFILLSPLLLKLDEKIELKEKISTGFYIEAKKYAHILD